MIKPWSRWTERDPFYSLKAWLRIRREALKRDNYECQYCKARGVEPVTPATEVHHVKPKREHPELALDLDNLVCLCWQCHEGTKRRHQRRTAERIRSSGVRVIKM